jgi:hypothetical protein
MLARLAGVESTYPGLANGEMGHSGDPARHQHRRGDYQRWGQDVDRSQQQESLIDHEPRPRDLPGQPRL